MGYEPLHHKYRPQTLAQLVGQDAIAQTLSHALAQLRIAPAYLFCGPRGTGKTSSARILSKSLNCLSHQQPHPSPCGTCDVCRGINLGTILDIVEIDAASNTGVDNIRELIERAQFAPVQCRYKVYVIDECHMLSTAAFNALLKTLEEPPAHVVFVLATTDPQRVLPTIISRCQRFDFRRIPLEAMVTHLQMIARQESIEILEEAIRLVAQVAQGGLRDAESLLDQLSLLAPPVTPEKVWDLVGAVPERDLLALVQAIFSDSSDRLLETARKLMDKGREPMMVLQGLAGFYRDLLIAKTAAQRADLVAVTPPTWEAMQAFVQDLDLSLLLAGQQTLRQAETQLRNTTQARLWLEVTLIGLLPSAIAAAPASPLQSRPASPPQMPIVPLPRRARTDALPPATPPESSAVSKASASAPAAPVTPSPAAPASPLAPPTVPDGAPSSPVDASTTGLTESERSRIWVQLIGRLHPMGTRALMQQQGHLISYDGQAARIGIKSRPLFKMAQGRVANIEAAFQQLFGHAVKVTLEVADAPDDPAPPTPPTAPSPPGKGPDKGPLSPAAASSKSASLAAGGEFPAPPRHQAGPGTLDGNSRSAASAWTSLSDLDRATKSFADFFNGQIVPPDEEAPNPRKAGPDSQTSSRPSSAPGSDVPF